MPDWVYSVAAFIVVTTIFTLLSMRTKKSSGQGAVTKIAPYSYHDSQENHHEGVKIFYRTDTGKKGKLDINNYAYNQFFAGLQVGDRLVKVAGEYMPKKA